MLFLFCAAFSKCEPVLHPVVFPVFFKICVKIFPCHWYYVCIAVLKIHTLLLVCLLTLDVRVLSRCQLFQTVGKCASPVDVNVPPLGRTMKSCKPRLILKKYPFSQAGVLVFYARVADMSGSSKIIRAAPRLFTFIKLTWRKREASRF